MEEDEGGHGESDVEVEFAPFVAGHPEHAEAVASAAAWRESCFEGKAAAEQEGASAEEEVVYEAGQGEAKRFVAFHTD